jgi:hypothetical protein
MNVSIIIVNYNTKDLLIQCLKSVYSKTEGIEFEIIVVDNNSNDGSEESIKTCFPEVIFIQSGANIGFGRANNLGIEKAKGAYVFLLNSDTILLNNAVRILHDYMVFDLKVGVCGGNLYNVHGKPTISFSQLMPSIFNDLDSFFGGIYSKIMYGKSMFFNHSEEAINIDGYVCGADMMIRKSVLDEVGLFDSDFFMYYEETELTWRIKRAGYKIASVPDARIIHLEGASEIIKENTKRRMIKSKYLYFEKINKQSYFKITFFILLLTAWSRIFFYYVSRNSNRVSYWISCLELNLQEHKLYKESKKY